MAKRTKFHIEPTTPVGWHKILNKETGACMDAVKGYDAALAAYRHFNNPHKVPRMPKELRAKSRRSVGSKARAAH